MTITNFGETLRKILVILTCLMLTGAIAGSSLVTVQANPDHFTLYALLTEDPYWGYYGGYHDLVYTVRDELTNIGINLDVRIYDAYTRWDIMWEEGWNVSGYDAPPPDGWDISTGEWWIWPTGFLWLEAVVYGWMTPVDIGVEWHDHQDGYNIMPWVNEKADDYLWKGMHTFDASDRQKYLWDWQEEFMHDPPMIPVYYGRSYHVQSAWLEGYDPVAWFVDESHMAINDTLFDLYAPDWRKSQPNTLIVALGYEPLWSFNQLFIETYTEERMVDVSYETLYTISIDPWPETGQEPEHWEYCTKPRLAADEPTFMDGPNGPRTRVRVPLREGVQWSDGDDFNATDVKFTYDLILNPETKAVAIGDISPAVQYVEYVSAAEVGEPEKAYTDPYTGQTGIHPYYVDFISPAPYPDITTILSAEWGGNMMPWHTLKDIAPKSLRLHPSTYDWTVAVDFLPSLGPFKLTNYVAGEFIEMTRNDLHFGYDLGWGPYGVETMILKWVPNAAARLASLKTHETDLGEYPVTSKEEFEALKEREDLRVWQYDYTTSNPLWLNLDGPYLSNRYVRQAIAHAIPYETIFNEILPSWGAEAYPGKALILPQNYYTDPDTAEMVHLFNEELEPYEHNITVAEMYMNMWVYSQEGTDFALGPVGDADFSGVVRLDDFIAWATNFGTEPEDWTFLPGNDIDPDFDNSGLVNLDDFIEWAANYGAYYPFEGAR